MTVKHQEVVLHVQPVHVKLGEPIPQTGWAILEEDWVYLNGQRLGRLGMCTEVAGEWSLRYSRHLEPGD